MTAISRTLNFENTSDGEEISKFTPPTRLMEEGPHLTRKLKTVSGRAAYEDVFLSLHNPLRVAISGTMAVRVGCGPFLKQNSE